MTEKYFETLMTAQDTIVLRTPPSTQKTSLHIHTQLPSQTNRRDINPHKLFITNTLQNPAHFLPKQKPAAHTIPHNSFLLRKATAKAI